MNAPAPGQRAPQAAPAAQSGPEQVALAQILVRVPEGDSSSDVAALRKKAESILAQLKQGGDFASLAASSSDGPEALQGGVMGARPLDGWPDLFVKAIASVAPGQVRGLIQSGNGVHLFKWLDRSGGRHAPGPAPAPQTPRGPKPAASCN